jgi:hypothetical protein
MENRDLFISQPAIGRPARLRAARIRRDTLTQLAAALIEDHDSSLQNALDALVQGVKAGLPCEAIDRLVEDIEDLAHMDDAAMNLTDTDLGQLEYQAAAAQTLTATVTTLPQPHQEGAAA